MAEELIFKYLSPDAVPHVLGNSESVTVKFSQPSAFNDPYELFLQCDAEFETQEERAFYEHILGDLPTLPVACFSSKPDSIVMWAHYCHEFTGVCIGLDEEALAQQFEHVFIEDVSYSETPAMVSHAQLQFAFGTAKRRHAISLMFEANSAAYFTKRSDWLLDAILLLGGDTTGRWKQWYEEAIPEAERLYEEHLTELRVEGLIDDDKA